MSFANIEEGETRVSVTDTHGLAVGGGSDKEWLRYEGPTILDTEDCR